MRTKFRRNPTTLNVLKREAASHLNNGSKTGLRQTYIWQHRSGLTEIICRLRFGLRLTGVSESKPDLSVWEIQPRPVAPCSWNWASIFSHMSCMLCKAKINANQLLLNRASTFSKTLNTYKSKSALWFSQRWSATRSFVKMSVMLSQSLTEATQILLSSSNWGHVSKTNGQREMFWSQRTAEGNKVHVRFLHGGLPKRKLAECSVCQSCATHHLSQNWDSRGASRNG